VNNVTMTWMVVATLGIFIADVAPLAAQSTLGGAKTQQNKIGGVAKPAPVIGGAAIHTPPPPTPPKPGPIVGAGQVKPGSPGAPTPGAIGTMPPGPTAGEPRPNPLVTPSNKGGPVVTSNLKCGSGACASRGPKP
jgi:hypothetical protein